MTEIALSFFTRYGQLLSHTNAKKNLPFPFKDHTQFPVLVDVLIRKNNHHLILRNDFSSKINTYFLQALLQHLSHESTPHPLRESELIYLDIEHIFIQTDLSDIEKDFQRMLTALETADKYFLLAVSFDPEDVFLTRQFNLLSQHPKCRLLFLTRAKKFKLHGLCNAFTLVNIHEPNEKDKLMILKQQRVELENFHHVLIPEESLLLAHTLAERYLSTQDTLEKTLLLLDSSAGRLGGERMNDNKTVKQVLTNNALMNVVSSWTQIPVSHLSANKFKRSEFIQGMQQRIFGQDAALTILSQELQQSKIHLQQSPGPFCSLLFCGVKHSGKKTVAKALAEQLFKQPDVLYCSVPQSSVTDSIMDIRLQRLTDKQYFSLQETMAECPYAIILFEEAERFSPKALDGLYEILSTGYLRDIQGKQHNFRQAILILSTTLGTDNLLARSQMLPAEEDASDLKLMQLILNEENCMPLAAHDYSPQELANEIVAEITNHLPAALCQHVRIIPFLPLTHSAIENIICLKLKALGKLLEFHHEIEFGYAPEVIHFLANDSHAMSIDKTLKMLYFTIEQAIHVQTENPSRPNQLFLQLNETGQLLRCDWLMMTASLRQHHSS